MNNIQDIDKAKILSIAEILKVILFVEVNDCELVGEIKFTIGEVVSFAGGGTAV